MSSAGASTMNSELYVTDTITIPEHELEVATSRAGGPGGQHVNKTSSRITVRWNIKQTTVLTDLQKERVLQKLHTQITADGDLIVHNSASRSQLQNRQMAYKDLARRVAKALHVPKRRMKTGVPKGAQEARLKSKTRRATIKKLRSKKIEE
jgi:ribosome-associated protein